MMILYWCYVWWAVFPLIVIVVYFIRHRYKLYDGAIAPKLDIEDYLLYALYLGFACWLSPIISPLIVVVCLLFPFVRIGKHYGKRRRSKAVAIKQEKERNGGRRRGQRDI